VSLPFPRRGPALFDVTLEHEGAGFRVTGTPFRIAIAYLLANTNRVRIYQGKHGQRERTGGDPFDRELINAVGKRDHAVIRVENEYVGARPQ
jgi:hypothetical protein